MSLKDQKESNLLNLSPYRLDESENGFVFDTDYGASYELAFRDDADYFPDEDFLGPLFSFAIALLDGQEQAKDPKLEETVVYALQRTFEANPNTIVTYTCYNSDGKAAVRSRKFRIWYSRIGSRDYERIEYENEESQLYAAVFFKKTHPLATQIGRFFDETYRDK